MVNFIQAKRVDFELDQCVPGYRITDDTPRLNLSVIPNPLEQTVGNPGSTPRPAGNFPEPFPTGLYLENSGGTLQDGLY